jgi:hypothetical protein
VKSPPRDAVDKYVEFHRFEPQQIGEFDSSFEIPSVLVHGGSAKWVTYRSGKVDPETLVRPRKGNGVDYIHEHDAGVMTFLRPGRDCPVPDAETVDVPSEFREVDALTRLGFCLGYCFVDHAGVKHEARGTRPLPDLYCVPSGKCLLVIQSRREVLAMVWGGGLGVFARGIDG